MSSHEDDPTRRGLVSMVGGGYTRPRRRKRWLIAGLVAVLLLGGGWFAQSALASTAFTSDFEDGSTRGWSKSGGTWSVVTDGSKVLTQTKASTSNAREFAGSTSWTDYTVSARVKPLGLGAGGFVGLVARASGSTTFYRLVLLSGDTVQLQVVKSGAVTVIDGTALAVPTGTWHTLSVGVAGSTISGYVDGVPVASGTNSTIAKGRVGLQTSYATASFDDVIVTADAPPTPVPTSTVTAAPTATATVGPTSSASPSPSAVPTTTPSPTTSVDPWNPPSSIKDALAATWQHMVDTYSDLYGFKNYGWDQVMAGHGTINYCVRWDSTTKVNATQRDQIDAAIGRQFNKWMAAMTEGGAGWNNWPYASVTVRVVGWAAKDRATLDWTDNAVDLYVNNLDEGGSPQCAPPCGRFFHQDGNYGGCPGGAAHHYDMSFWPTDGLGGGAGGDWGQRVDAAYFLGALSSDNIHILLHEMGHTFGLDDFYDWTPPGVCCFIMNAGTATEITEFDKWMLRDFWRHIKSRYGL